MDPVHGRRKCKCASLRETLDVGKRDGVDIMVEFVYSPDEEAMPEQELAITSIEGAKDMAGFLDQEVEKIPWEQEAPPEPSLDLFDAVTSVGDQIEVQKSRFVANMARLASKMEKLDKSIDRVKDPNSQPARRNARRLGLAARRLEQQATAPPNPTKYVILARDIGLISLAALHDMVVTDLLKLNPPLKRKTTVKQGTYVRVNRAT